MTFKKFEELVKKYRPDIEKVTNHGQEVYNPKYVSKSDKTVILVWFKGNKNWYTYKGSYLQILNKLNIPVCSKYDVELLEESLAKAKAEDGTYGVFNFCNKPIDNTETIAMLEKELAELRKLEMV